MTTSMSPDAQAMASAIPTSLEAHVDLQLPFRDGREVRLRLYDFGPLGVLVREDLYRQDGEDGGSLVGTSGTAKYVPDWKTAAKVLQEWTRVMTTVMCT